MLFFIMLGVVFAGFSVALVVLQVVREELEEGRCGEGERVTCIPGWLLRIARLCPAT